jgi:Holliday junction resolvasome RuvABC endonuclease subunit
LGQSRYPGAQANGREDTLIDPTTLAPTIKALRTGRITADHHPARIADLLEALAQAVTDQRAHIDELERTYMTPATNAAMRTEYARGFRAAQYQMAAKCPDMEPLIFSVGPHFAAASEGSAG